MMASQKMCSPLPCSLLSLTLFEYLYACSAPAPPLHYELFFFFTAEAMQAISLRAAYRALLRISTSVPSEGPEGRDNLAKVRLPAIRMYAPSFVSYVIYGQSCQCID